MRFSVVTVSFNQAEFLERTIQSVLSQEGVDIEYIIVDPGSTDGSREIIERYRDRFAHIVFEKDEGAADGLNRGFARASGDVYCYLNSDDTFEPNAFRRVKAFLEERSAINVACGHAWVIDSGDNRLRRVWSEPYRPFFVAHGAATHIQPSTFIRREAFLRSGGFNKENKSNWDGELLVDLYLSGAKIAVIDAMLSNYRLHSVSITNSGKLDLLINSWRDRRFRKLFGRDRGRWDAVSATFALILKRIFQYRNTIESIVYGKVYRRGV